MTAPGIEELTGSAGHPPRALIVTVFGLYAREVGGWLGVGALIRLMAVVGVDEPAVRSSISRLKRRGILLGERRDGVAGYALSPYAEQVLALGDRRIFDRAAHDESGWVLAVFSVPESERNRRHTLRTRLSWLGFGTVSSGVWIAPAWVADDARRVLADEGLDRFVDLFRAEYLAFGDPAQQAARWWDLEGIDVRYREFRAVHEPMLRRWRAEDPEAAPEDAFGDYLRVLTAWRRLPFLDPGLPSAVLPAQWSGTAAAAVFFDLRALLQDAAHAFALHR